MSRIKIRAYDGNILLDMDIKMLILSLFCAEKASIKTPYNIETHTNFGTEIITVNETEESDDI